MTTARIIFIFRWMNGKLPQEEFHKMMGLVAFARDIEPAFEASLRKKYGNDTLDQILGGPSFDPDNSIPF